MSNTSDNPSKKKTSGLSKMLSSASVGKILLPAILVFIFLAIRLPALGRFVTADEALWLRSSANFYYAVRQGDWENTFQSSHPGVTTMWAGAMAFQIVFPEYEELGDRETSDFQLRHLLLRKGINPIELLAVGRAISVLINGLAFAMLWVFALELFGKWAAFTGMAILALDPFLIGQQRLLHQDGLLTSFMLLALFAFIAYVQSGKLPGLLISGVATGLAGLTKSPGWFLIPLVIMVSIWLEWRRESKRKKGVWDYLKTPIIWAGAAGLAVFLFYPAMWVRPALMIGSMVEYALNSAEGVFSGPVFFAGSIYPNADLGTKSWIFYPVSFLWRSSPLTILGLIFAAVYVWKGGKKKEGKFTFQLWNILLFGVIFTLLMNLGVKKFARYYLPVMAAFMMLAGWGLANAIKSLRSKKIQRLQKIGIGVIVLGTFGMQILGVQESAPYFVNYYNPLLGGASAAQGTMQMGWGEGMEEAGRYLMEQPNIEEKEVAAWYSTSFNLLFEHDALHIPITPNLPQGDLENMLERDYLVTYLHQWQRGTPNNLLELLEEMNPVFRYQIDGLDYVRVYAPGEN
jgi:hypothetical protein